MSKPKLPGGNPFAKPIPPGLSPFDVAALMVANRRGWSGPIGMSMKEGDDPDDTGDGDDPDPDAEVTIDGKTYTVKDLQRIMAEEKRQGKRSGERSVLEQLGVDDVDTAKALIEAAQEAARKDETEAQRKAREAEEERRKAEAEKAKAAEEKRATQLERALIRRGCTEDDDLRDALALLDREVEEDADADAIAAAADKLKERRAELFGATEERQAPPGGRGRLPGGGPGRQHKPQKVFGAGGIERAKRLGYIKD